MDTNAYRSRLSRVQARRRRKPVRKRVIVAFLVALLLVFGVFIWNNGSLLSILWSTIFRPGYHLKEQPDKTINILLLGVGGGTHEGPDLTDTIIFAHLDPKNKKVTLVSIPRDLWVPSLHGKINSAYTVASENKSGSGLTFTKSLVGTMLNQPINYSVKIDFSGFVKAVDIAGGLDINVDNTFDDYQYPIAGNEAATCGMSADQIASAAAQVASGSETDNDAFPCRYKHIHFTKGTTHMDGETSLEYVRSRHALGKEGSDFARSKRQEKVISAFKAKIFSVGTLINPVKVMDLISTLKGSIETDIAQNEYSDFIHLAEDMKGAKITSAIVDTGDEENSRYGLLINPPESPEFDYAWVLTPRAGSSNYSEIQQYVACQIAGTNCFVGHYGIVIPTPKPTAPSSK